MTRTSKQIVAPHFARMFAVGLAGISAAAHTILGTMDTLMPVMQTDLPLFVRGTIWAAWHMVSGFLILSAYVFWQGGSAARYFGWLYLLGGALFIAIALHLEGAYGLITLPQWVLLLPAGGAALMAGPRLPLKP